MNILPLPSFNSSGSKWNFFLPQKEFVYRPARLFKYFLLERTSNWPRSTFILKKLIPIHLFIYLFSFCRKFFQVQLPVISLPKCWNLFCFHLIHLWAASFEHSLLPRWRHRYQGNRHYNEFFFRRRRTRKNFFPRSPWQPHHRLQLHTHQDVICL